MKNKGCGGGRLFKDGLGPWRSMSVCFFMLPSSFILTYFRFLFVKLS
jgi:hypothetical protein